MSDEKLLDVTDMVLDSMKCGVKVDTASMPLPQRLTELNNRILYHHLMNTPEGEKIRQRSRGGLEKASQNNNTL